VGDAGEHQLSALAADLDQLRFELSGPAAAALRTERDRVARLLRGVVARTDEPRAPLLVVVGGGSGAGKSTTVNSLARANATTTGVVRPTTRVPTLVCHPEDRAWFADDRVLPDLVRVPAAAGPGAAAPEPGAAAAEPGSAAPEPGASGGGVQLEGRQLRLATSPHLPLGVALLDTPDIDSVALVNHVLADEALDAADAWLWLATARTYADEVGMTYLRRATARHALAAVAITQIRPHERDEVLADVDRLLAAEAVTAAARFEVPFATVTDGRVPGPAVAELRAWLAALAPTDRRVAVREQALSGLRQAVPTELAPLVAAAGRELEVADRLTRSVTERFAGVEALLVAELDAGLSLRAEVLDRWQRLVGGNEALLRVQTTAAQLTDLVRARLGRPTREDTRQVQVEVAGELTRIVARLLEGAARAARNDLEADPIGQDVLAGSPALRREPPDRTGEVRRMIADWETTIAELVERVGGPRRAQARRTTTALNAVATSAILVLFTLSGGLTGGEVGIAAAAAGASQWLLLKLLGERNLQQLLHQIRVDLLARVDTLAAVERAAFVTAIARTAPPHDVVASLAAAAGGTTS
jgi:energy-coupling factor transporter ATP-binding protein EcfA2